MDKATGDIVVERAISSIRNKEKTIDLVSLKELAAEAESLASELYMSLAKIMEWIDDHMSDHED